MATINLSNVNRIGIVIVSYHYKKGRKIFSFNSRLQLFSSYKEATQFEIELLNKLRSIDEKNIHESYYVSPKYSVPPPEGLSTKDMYYCPHCCQVNYLNVNLITGYKNCPICHCSIADYDFKRYNELWHKDSKQANTGKILKKRRRKKKDESKT